MGVIFICGQKALFVAAVRASYKNGFMPEAYRRAERIALARLEDLSAIYAEVFFFGGVLRRDKRGEREPT